MIANQKPRQEETGRAEGGTGKERYISNLQPDPANVKHYRNLTLAFIIVDVFVAFFMALPFILIMGVVL